MCTGYRPPPPPVQRSPNQGGIVGTIDRYRGVRRARLLGLLGLMSLLAVALLSGGTAYAKGGTAKPPPGSTAPWVVSTLPDPSSFGSPLGAADVHGFDSTGYLQHATVDAPTASCPNPGGTALINGDKITIPCNMVVQMPANTLTWQDVVNGPPVIDGFVTGSLRNALSGTLGEYNAYEFHAIGNIVAGKRVAGLVYMSQQSRNVGSGTIAAIDWTTGKLTLDSGAVVQINDPKGRFGLAHSDDQRFSV